MKRLLFLLPFLLACDLEPMAQANSNPTWEVRFSPRGGCAELIIDHINQAKSSIYVQAYSFTSFPITEALISAHHRGVKVSVILDKSNENGNGSLYRRLIEANIPVVLDRKHAIAHNKVMIIDQEKVETGSFNFTAAAENSNAENCLIIKDSALAWKYLENWKKHNLHSD